MVNNIIGDIMNLSNNAKLLKELLLRLNTESLEEVQKDFVKAFKDLSYNDVLYAEEELYLEGSVNLERLCDIHSALFHNEKNNYLANDIKMTNDNPLNILIKENNEMEKIVDYYLNNKANYKMLKSIFKEIEVHYKKKSNLIYPILKSKYNFNGPHEVMWKNDDIIISKMNSLTKNDFNDEELLTLTLNKIKEMIYKENNILYPNAFDLLGADDLKLIEEDLHQFKEIFNVRYNKIKNNDVSFKNEIINFKYGKLSLKEINGILNAIPIEISYVNNKNINKYYNEGEKLFKRPALSLENDVFSCHPKAKENIVLNIIDDLKNKRKSDVSIFIKKEQEDFLIKYKGVWDKDEFLGTIELIYPLNEFKKYLNKN